MTGPAAASSQHERAARRGPTGTVVLSSSCRLLFIDRAAIDLLGRLDPDFSPRTGTELLPPGLLTIAREIAAQYSVIDAGPQSPLAQVSRLLGLNFKQVRVEGFPVPCSQRLETRIVLVLSPCDLGVP